MKKLILKKLLLSSCFSAVFFLSCEKESLIEENSNYQSNIKKEKVNFDDFKKNEKAFIVFKNLNLIDSKSANKNSNSQNSNSYDFEINFDSGTHFSYNNLESYTFPIRRVINNGLLENIVIYKHTDGRYYAKLLKYNLTLHEKNDLANDELESIQNPIVTELLGEYYFGNQIQSDCGWITITTITACANGHTSASQCQLTGSAAPRIRTITVAIPCDGDSGSGGGGTGDGSGGYYGDPFNVNGGGGGYITPSFPNDSTPTEYYENGISEPVLTTENSVDIRNANLFYQSLSLQQQQWVSESQTNQIAYSQIVQYLIDNQWSSDSNEVALEMINFFKERDWKAEIKQAISTGITSSAELTHKMYSKLSVIATNHPMSINFINIIIDGIRTAASTVIDTNPNTCNWTDLFNMWMFELGPNPINFNGPSIIVNSLQNQQGVRDARNIALNQIVNGNLNPIPSYVWNYNQDAFYTGMVNGNIATSFLGTYVTNVTITTLPYGQHQLTFTVTNPSSWESATRLRIDNNHDGYHDGIFPNHERGQTNTLHIGGNFNQIWKWTETY